jgi:hypothetical protein
MWQIDNKTPFAAGQGWVRNLDGAETWLVVVKATFDILTDGSTRIARAQAPVIRSPVYLGEAGRSSIVYEHDFCLGKVGTDIVVNGSAHAPGGRPATSVDAGFRVGGLSKVLRVFGDRTWGPMGTVISDPIPFTTMPIVYERAYGGADRCSPQPDVDSYFANPVGTGFIASRASAARVALPNVEYPDQLIDTWDARPKPAGFGVIGAAWAERAALTGTFDQAWKERRFPLLPGDFDMRHHQSVPRDQQTAAFLTGGEGVALLNLTPAGMLRFDLPQPHLVFLTVFADGERREHLPQLHSVIIEPSLLRVLLVWHSALECHAKAYQLDLTRIVSDSMAHGSDDAEVGSILGSE